MKNTMTKLSLAALATAFALPTFAGGLTTPVPEPVIVQPAPVYAPSNDWTGAYIGAQIGYGDIGSGGAGLDGDGALGGVHAGYRHDFGQFVTGVELDYDTSNIDLGVGGDTLDSVARLKFIAGADMGNTLFYATAGGARAKATLGGVGTSDNGYFLGLGAAYAMNDNWTVGAEVLGHRFDDFGGTGVDLKATTISARIGYKF